MYGLASSSFRVARLPSVFAGTTLPAIAGRSDPPALLQVVERPEPVHAQRERCHVAQPAAHGDAPVCVFVSVYGSYHTAAKVAAPEAVICHAKSADNIIH